MRLFRKLRRKLDYLSSDKVDSVHQAYLVALDAHRGQKRRTGEPYITHPVSVACVLADMKMDHQSLMGALLHDVIEDTPVTKAELAEQFGETVAELVDGVSKLTQIEFVSRLEAQAENFRKMVLAMSKDIRVILIKLADRLHNMRTLGSLSPQKQRRIAAETLDIFAPIAKRLGMRDLSVELEELSFKMLYPHRHAILKDSVRRARGNRKKILNLIERRLRDGLEHSNLATWTITGREKHLYSIYRKMRDKHVPFNEIMDVYAFRVIVDTNDACYRVLGLVHSLYKPVPERFKDYIAIPKANGYQSLHTTLFGPYGLPVEIQIRTQQMHDMATNGIAAHWVYKDKIQGSKDSQERAKQWVKNLLELQRSTGSPQEFIESVKIDLFPDEVYVFTPRGDIMELPSRATAVDFAYAVHTDVGNSCVAARIDRQLAPLSAPLSNGQTVEVITAPRTQPNPAWLDFVVTSKARSGIRYFLKSQRRSESVALGKQLLEKALSQHSLSTRSLSKELLHFLVQEAQLKAIDDLYEDIGLGNRVPHITAQHIADLVSQEKSEPLPDPETVGEREPLVIRGTEGMVLQFADCCHPIPGDPIIGVLNAGRGVVVHTDVCRRITKLCQNIDNVLPLRWSNEIDGDFLVTVGLHVLNKRGALAGITLAVSDANANIEDIVVEERDGEYYAVQLQILVHNRQHLAEVIRMLRQIVSAKKIHRL